MKLGNEGEINVGETDGTSGSPWVISTSVASLGGMSGATATATALVEAAEPEVPASDCSSQ